jgi:hypothetical protein
MVLKYQAILYYMLFLLVNLIIFLIGFKIKTVKPIKCLLLTLNLLFYKYENSVE